MNLIEIYSNSIKFGPNLQMMQANIGETVPYYVGSALVDIEQTKEDEPKLESR